jgi:hypothetical protein
MVDKDLGVSRSTHGSYGRVAVTIVLAAVMAIYVTTALAAAPAASAAAHDPIAVIVTGDLVEAPGSMATYSGDAYWLTKAEFDALKVSRGVLDPHGDLWVTGWYSWCHDHGVPDYGWARVAGIGLKELLADAGLSASQISALGVVTVTASAELDSYAFAVDLDLVRHRFMTVGGPSAGLVDPMLAVYMDDASSYAGMPAEAATPVDSAFTTLVYGQLTSSESNRCGFVAGASLVTLPATSDAFVIDAPDKFTAGERQRTVFSLATLITRGEEQRTYKVDGSAVTCDGVDLAELLGSARGAIAGQDRLVLETSDGAVDLGLCVADVKQGDLLLAYSSRLAGGSPVANRTQVMLYGSDVAVADALALRVEHVDPTAGLSLTAPTVAQAKASVAVRTKLALRAVAVPAHGASAPGAVTWTTSSPKVATVSSAGTVTARREGSAVVRATSGVFTRAFTVKVVSRKANATGISLPRSKSVSAGAVMRLAVRIRPAASTSTIGWKSSDRAVATVDDGGTITALKKGRTTITVRTSNGRTARCALTVR